MILGKINSDGFIEMYEANNLDKETKLRNAGYSELILSPMPICEPGYKSVDKYNSVYGKIIQLWEILLDDNVIRQEINCLKAKLSSSDYKVIKNMEATMNGLTLPYNLEKLTSERSVIREEINALEEKLL